MKKALNSSAKHVLASLLLLIISSSLIAGTAHNNPNITVNNGGGNLQSEKSESEIVCGNPNGCPSRHGSLSEEDSPKTGGDM